MSLEDNPDYETVEYHLIYAELIKAARHRGTVTYQQLALVVGLPVTGNYMGKRLGELLGTISENEVKQGRPMLSALAVNTSEKPGPGFMPWAEQLGLLNKGDDPTAFWKEQCNACYQTWKQHYSKK